MWKLSPPALQPFHRLHDYATYLIFSFPTSKIGVIEMPTLKSCWRGPVDNVQGGLSSAWCTVNTEGSWSVVTTQVCVRDSLLAGLFHLHGALHTKLCPHLCSSQGELTLTPMPPNTENLCKLLVILISRYLQNLKQRCISAPRVEFLSCLLRICWLWSRN